MEPYLKDSNTTFVKVKSIKIVCSFNDWSYSNTTFVKVKCAITAGIGLGAIIQIQHLLKLNQIVLLLYGKKLDSNTTFVKVKLIIILLQRI